MPVSPQTARREPAQCHLRPLRSPSSRSEHFEGSRGGRLRSRRHALHRQISHSRISYPIHHSGGREQVVELGSIVIQPVPENNVHACNQCSGCSKSCDSCRNISPAHTKCKCIKFCIHIGLPEH